MPKLLHEVIASISEPPVTSFTPEVIRREGIEISEVRLENDDTVQLFLDLVITDSQGYQLCPHVIFKNWQIVSSVWCV